METCEKPEVTFKTATIPCKRYGELIVKEKRAIPELEKMLNEANKLKYESYVTMKSKHHKLVL